MEGFLRDIRYVSRTLLRSPGFTAVTVLTLALGIGATTAIFSVVNGVLLRPLPYPEPDRIVQLWQVNGDNGHTQVSDPNFDDWQARSHSFAALAQLSQAQIVSVSGTREPTRVRAAQVSRDFFRALGVRPIVGRGFTPEEQQVGGARAVVVSQSFWRRYLDANPDLARARLTFENQSFDVVGVMPPALDYPAGVDLWVPRELEPRSQYRTGHNWLALGRLKDGVSLEQAQREMSAISRELRRQYGDDTWMTDAAVVPLQEQIVGRARPALLVLLGASAFLLLIACSNVVNLLLARAAARQGELAVRLALGAARARLAQQFLAESLVLSLAAGVLGVAIAWWGVRALLALEPGGLPRLGEIGLSWPVLLFALAISVLTALGLGLFTALRGTRGDIRQTLAQSQRTQAGIGASSRIRGALVVTQMAMTVVLLIGAGLLGRSFLRLLDVNPGFRTDRGVVVDLSLPWPNTDAERATTVRFYDDLIARLRALPGVTEAGAVNSFPLAGGSAGDGTFLIMTRPDEPLDMRDLPRLMKDPSRTGSAEYRVASGGYFRAMGIPLIRGRLFDERDAPDAPHVAVISASLAKTRWPDEDPIGKVIQFGNMDGDLRPFTIVGVVGDVRESSLASNPRPTFYGSFRQRSRRSATMNVVIQGSAAPVTLIAQARRLVSELRPDVPPRLRTVESVVATSIADRRFVLLLIGVFGATALVLATMGVYSVIAYLVAQRKREIGVRIALGAQMADVLRLVLGQGATMALVGIGAGVLASFWLTRLLAGMLYGIGTADPVAFAAVIVVLATVALLASWIPARRAARVDPMTVLRGS